MSLIIKLPDYKHIYNPVEKFLNYYKDNQNCWNVWINNNSRLIYSPIDSKTFVESHYMDLLTKNGQDLRNYIKSRLNVLKSYQIPQINNSNKNKRSVWSVFGGLLFSAVTTGITEYQIYKINSHVSENQNDIKYITTKLREEHTELLSVKNNIVGLVKRSTNLIMETLRTQQCISISNHFLQNWKINFEDYKKTTDDILESAISGQNNLLLTPKMVDPNLLESIVSSSTIFDNTSYQENPNLLYSVARLSLIEIDKNLTMGHFTLNIPRFNSKQIKNLLEVKQVGLHIRNNLCNYFKIPKYVYEKNGQFHPIKIDNCLKHNRLFICSEENAPNSTSCLQYDNITCESYIAKCEGVYKFAMSHKGILLRNNIKSNTFITNREGYTRLAELSARDISYFDWADIIDIQFGEIKIPSPQGNNLPLFKANYSVNLPLDIKFVDLENITNAFNSLCNKYNQSMDSIMLPISEFWDLQRDKNNNPLSTLDNGKLLIILLLIIIWNFVLSITIILLVYKLKKHNYQILEKENIPLQTNDNFDLRKANSSDI